MNHTSYAAGDRVRRSPAYLHNIAGLADIGGRVFMQNHGPMAYVRWDDGSVSWGIHHTNITREA